MPLLLVVLFVVVPLVELVVIIQVGQVIGTAWTVALLVADSVLGAWLLRREGRRAWQQFRAALEEMRWPGDEVTQGALVIVGGTLLLTPGFVTDVVGFLLLLSPTRAVVSRVLRARLTPAPVQGYQAVRGRRGGEDGRRSGRKRTDHGASVLDVEVVEVRREPTDDAPASGPDAVGRGDEPTPPAGDDGVEDGQGDDGGAEDGGQDRSAG
jgi:UPF0716 protein FxsA